MVCLISLPTFTISTVGMNTHLPGLISNLLDHFGFIQVLVVNCRAHEFENHSGQSNQFDGEDHALEDQALTILIHSQFPFCYASADLALEARARQNQKPRYG